MYIIPSHLNDPWLSQLCLAISIIPGICIIPGQLYNLWPPPVSATSPCWPPLCDERGQDLQANEQRPPEVAGGKQENKKTFIGGELGSH